MNRSIRTGQWLLSGLAGLVTAVVLHFMLYHISLPLKPFIYVVF
jgi:hypothetical protein